MASELRMKTNVLVKGSKSTIISSIMMKELSIGLEWTSSRKRRLAVNTILTVRITSNKLLIIGHSKYRGESRSMGIVRILIYSTLVSNCLI